MECPRCGTDLRYRTRFCPTCGIDVSELTVGLESSVEFRRGFWSTTSEPASESEADSALDVGTNPEPVQDSVPEPKPEPEGVPEPEPDPEVEPEPEPEPEVELEPVPASESEPTSESEPETEFSPKLESDLEFGPEPEPTSESEIPSDPSPKDEPDVRQDEAKALTPSDSSPQSSNESELSAQRQIPKFVQASLDFVRRDRRVKMIVVALLVALVSLVGFFQISSCERALSEQERAAAEQRRLSSPIDKEIVVVAANYDAEHGAPIPLHVVGDAKNGMHVDQTMTVDVSDPKLALLPGTYVVTAGGSLVTDQGAFYHGPVDSYTVEVRDEESSAGDDFKADATGVPAAITPVFAYELVAPEHVTDADLEELRGWMTVASVKDSQRYVDAVMSRRAEAQQRIAQEDAARDEEERAQTERTAREVEEALQSNTQVGSDRVAFSLPESWRGSVRTTQSVDSAGRAVTIVHLPGNQYAELARVFFSSGYVGAGADGTLRHVAAYRNASDGSGHTEAQTLNWPLIAAMGAESQYGVSQAELYELVSLSTGGALSYDYVRYTGGYDAGVSQAEPNFSAAAFSSLAAI